MSPNLRMEVNNFNYRKYYSMIENLATFLRVNMLKTARKNS